MRIAIVLNTSWNIYNFRMSLIQALLAAGHEVVAIAPPDAYSERLTAAGCRYVPLHMAQSSSPLDDIRLLWTLYRLYRKLRLDVVLHYTIKPNIYGALAAHRLGIPAINNVSGLGTVFISKGLVTGVALRLYRWVFRHPAKVFFQNEDDRQLFLRHGLVQAAITKVLPGSGIDLDKFVPQGSFVRHRPFTFLLISRLLYEKGVAEYVEASRLLKAKFPEVQCQILGRLAEDSRSGIDRDQLRAWQQEGVITYLGATDDVASIIAEADCVVLPSYREGTSRTLLEGAAMAKPLIATNVPGCREVVQDGVNGLLCRVRNAADLAAKMEQMLQFEDADLERMGRAGRNIVEERFDDRIVIAEYLKAIEEVTRK